MSQPQYESGDLSAGQWVGVGAGTSGDVNQANRPQIGAGAGGSPVNPPNLAGQQSCGIGISGTWTGTLTFEGTVDGTNYVATPAVPYGGGSPVTTTSANGIFVASLAGCVGFRVRATAMTVGAATVVLAAQDNPPPQGAGGGFATDLSSTATLTHVSAATSSVSLLSANPARIGLMIQNNSTGFLDIALGAAAATTAFSASVAAGGAFELPGTVGIDYTGAVNGVWFAAAGNAQITEFTA